MSWAVAMTSSARPRRRLAPRAVALGAAVRPVSDCSDRMMGGEGALPAPGAGEVTIVPLSLGVRGRHRIPVIAGLRQRDADAEGDQAGNRLGREQSVPDLLSDEDDVDAAG
jgi:hypothetical protein